MLDYPALAALAAVVREGSFERAARALHVTPSAVSQRVRQLEARTGRILIQRGPPCAATPEALQLLRHQETVQLLERELLQSLPWLRAAPLPAERLVLRIGINADSLATWFMDALATFHAQEDVLFDLQVEDQDHTIELMRSAQVLAAVSSQSQPLQGFGSTPLGALRYQAVASAAFVRRHFGGGFGLAAWAGAPSLRFNHKDELQDAWLARQLAEPPPPLHCHWMASSHGFVDAARAGLGWGLVPAALAGEDLARGTLVELLPGQVLDVPLFWHCARRPPPALQRLEAAVRAAAQAGLVGA